MGVEYSEVPTDEISLRLDNPRFGTDTVANEEEAIGKLAKAPDFLDFTRDISKVGLNPMDIIGVYEENGSYVAGEGNRRFCAIKLLNDPTLAPDDIQDAIEELSKNTEFEFDEVYCCIFDDYDKMQDFVSRMHTPGPARRKSWSAEAQQIASGQGKNAVAVALTQFARNEAIYSGKNDEIEVTTLERWAKKPAMMALLGLQMKNGVIYTYRNKATTKKILRALIKLIESVDNPSRWNKPDIELKAADLRQELSISPANGKAKLFSSFLKPGKGKGLSGGNGSAPANPLPPSGKPIPKPKPPKPPSLEKIAQDSEIVNLLDSLGYYKLQSLYYSLTSTRLDNNVPMLSVVAWSLLECLAAADGSQRPFPQHLNKKWLFNAGLIPTIKESEKQKPYLQAIKDISLKGNASKHDVQSGGFDKNELATNIHILNPLLKELIKQAIAKK